jgi:hypothetical protein
MNNQIIEIPSHQYYAFRAECEGDVHLFLSAIAWDLLESEISSESFADNSGFKKSHPDRDVKITTSGNLSLEQLRWVADQIEDCRVIADSISPAASYTGERLYGEYVSSTPTLHLAKISTGLKKHREYLSYQQVRAKKALRNTDNRLIPISVSDGTRPVHSTFSLVH